MHLVKTKKAFVKTNGEQIQPLLFAAVPYLLNNHNPQCLLNKPFKKFVQINGSL